jgi:hypothetical protein
MINIRKITVALVGCASLAGPVTYGAAKRQFPETTQDFARAIYRSRRAFEWGNPKHVALGLDRACPDLPPELRDRTLKALAAAGTDQSKRQKALEELIAKLGKDSPPVDPAPVNVNRRLQLDEFAVRSAKDSEICDVSNIGQDQGYALTLVRKAISVDSVNNVMIALATAQDNEPDKILGDDGQKLDTSLLYITLADAEAQKKLDYIAAVVAFDERFLLNWSKLVKGAASHPIYAGVLQLFEQQGIDAFRDLTRARGITFESLMKDSDDRRRVFANGAHAVHNVLQAIAAREPRKIADFLRRDKVDDEEMLARPR